MMGRRKRRKSRKKDGNVKKDVKNVFVFRLIMVSLVFLLVLVFSWLGLFVLEENSILMLDEENVEDNELKSYKGLLDVLNKEIIFYSIVGVVLIIIFLVIWLFIVEKNRGEKVVGSSLGVIGEKDGKEGEMNDERSEES